jgi:hypothetical protein
VQTLTIQAKTGQRTQPSETTIMPHRIARLVLAAAVMFAVSATGPAPAEAKSKTKKKKTAVASFVARSETAPARGFNTRKFFDDLERRSQ